MALIAAQPFAKMPSADLGDAITTAKVFQTSASAPIVLPLASASELKNRLFRVRAWGRVVGGTTVNFTPSLYYGTSATLASDTVIKAATAAAVDSASHSWHMIADIVWDADSDKLQGAVYFRIAAVAITALVVNAAISSVDPELGTTAQGLVMSGLFSTTSAGNHAYLDGFELEV